MWPVNYTALLQLILQNPVGPHRCMCIAPPHEAHSHVITRATDPVLQTNKADIIDGPCTIYLFCVA